MRAIIPVLILGLAACASSPSETTTRTGTQTVRIVDGSGNVTALSTDASTQANLLTIELPVDRAWAGLIAAYTALSLPVDDLDNNQRSITANVRARGRIGNARLSTYLDCGRTQGGPSADTYEVHLLVQSRILPGELNTSRIGTAIEAVARPSNFASSPVRCTSTGNLEHRIVGHIRRAAWPEPGP